MGAKNSKGHHHAAGDAIDTAGLPPASVVIQVKVFFAKDGARIDGRCAGSRGRVFHSRPVGWYTFQSWWTHFAVQLTFQGGTSLFLERDVHGVYLRPRELVPGLDYETYSSRIAAADGSSRVFLQDVLNFVHREQQVQYDFMHKNCKHLAYDFFYQVLGQRDDLGGFLSFCGRHEAVWKAKVM